ncbi:hypothetical protein ACWDV4_24020 [Micromonospora sp. NPDC003197]
MESVQTRQARTPDPETGVQQDVSPRPMPQDGESISLSLPELRKAIAESDGVTNKLTDARGAWAGETNDPEQALGLREANQAYQRMQDAWFDEIGVYMEALALVNDGLERAANTYDETEQSGTRALGQELL